MLLRLGKVSIDLLPSPGNFKSKKEVYSTKETVKPHTYGRRQIMSQPHKDLDRSRRHLEMAPKGISSQQNFHLSIYVATMRHE